MIGTQMTRFFLIVLSFTMITSAGDLTIHLSGIKGSEGDIRVAIFNSPESYDKRSPIYSTAFATMCCEMQFTFKDIPDGDYALKLYHDKNGNGKLDKGLFGIPKEHYAFSNNVRHAMRAASFEEALFTISGDCEIDLIIK